jgi:RHS repeat-associated protein
MGENYRITITDPLRNKEEYYSFGTFSWYISPNDYVPHTSPDSNNYKSAKKTLYILTESHETGKISKIQSPEGGYIEYRDYDPITKSPKTIKDNHGSGVSHTTQYTYNTNGRLTSFTDAKGNITTLNYYANNIDINDIRVDLINTAGNDDIILKTFTYNGSTRDIETVTERPGTTVSTTTRFTYRPNGQIDTITNAQGSPIESVTSFVYDGSTYDLSEIRKNGNTVASFTYDNIGRVKTHTDDKGLTITYWEYSDLNMPAKITFPDTIFNAGIPESKFINISYSACCPRLIDSRTDRAGLTTNYTYDALRRLKKVQSPEGTIRYDYDANGNLKALTDADGKSTKFDYDHDNRLTKKIFENDKFIKYDYDSAGLLRKITNARSIEISYPDYDENHNLKTIDYSDTTPDVTYTYDDYDRLETMTVGTERYQYGYDELNRLKTTDGPWDDDTITYRYDELGNIKSLSPQIGQTITYNYDYDYNPDIGRLKDIQAGANTYTYNYTGVNPQVQSLTRPNGSVTTYYYDPLKRLKTIDNQDSSAQTINKHTFTYNEFDIISTEEITTGTALDAFTAEQATYDYNNLNQLTDISSGETFIYDEDGNMTQGYTSEGYQYTAAYDAENRLKTLTYNDGNNDHEIKYFYSGDSMLARIEKWDDTMTSGTMERRDEVRFLRAGFLTIQERDENNTIEREYTWGIDMAGGIGGLLNLKQNDQDYSYLYDGTGNVMNVVKDIDESIVASYRYDIFGKPLKKTGTFDQPYRFSTKRYDEATGLSYYGYRFYIPELGRWINRDPLGEAGEINLYGFVGNNPVSFVDPYGLLQITVGWSGGNILGGSGSVTWDSNTNQVTGSLGAGLGGGSGFTIAAGSSKPPADSEVSSGVMFTGTGGFRGFGGFFSWGGNNKGESVTDWGVGFGFGFGASWTAPNYNFCLVNCKPDPDDPC